MGIDEATNGSLQKYSFRRLIRYAIAAQVILIAVIVAIAIWGALQTTERSNDLQQASGNVLLVQGMTQEFDRSRAALRQYVASGDAFTLGPFTQARRQITVIANSLYTNLDEPTAALAREYNDALQSYLVDIGDNAVAAVKRGDQDEARKILVSTESAQQFEEVLDARRGVSRRDSRPAG